MEACLRKCKSTIYNNVGPCHEAGCIRGTKDVGLKGKGLVKYFGTRVTISTYSLQFVRLAETTVRCLGYPLAFPVLRIVLYHLSGDVARTDTVYPAEINPLDRQALG